MHIGTGLEGTTGLRSGRWRQCEQSEDSYRLANGSQRTVRWSWHRNAALRQGPRPRISRRTAGHGSNQETAGSVAVSDEAASRARVHIVDLVSHHRPVAWQTGAIMSFMVIII